jgi:hypothetical protein
MQVNYKIHVLEDEYRYIEVDSIINEQNEYILLAQETNLSNICLRKIINENNEQFYRKLSAKEFNDIFSRFLEKNKQLFE